MATYSQSQMIEEFGDNWLKGLSFNEVPNELTEENKDQFINAGDEWFGQVYDNEDECFVDDVWMENGELHWSIVE